MDINSKMKNGYRRMLSFLVVLCLTMGLVTLMSITASANPGGGGSGSASDPFLINNLAELQEFRNRVNSGTTYLNQHIRLTANISLSDIANWTPIGNTSDRAFQGTFNGGGFTINGLTITSASGGGQGFFGRISASGTVQNVTLTDVNINITSSVNDVGGIVGLNTGTIRNCSVSGNITSGGLGIGGIAGFNSGTISDCWVNVSIVGINTIVGGIVGANQGTVSFCYALGTVRANNIAGGIVGDNRANGIISNCVALNDSVISAGANAGRIVGNNSGTRSNNQTRPDMLIGTSGTAPTVPTANIGANLINGSDLAYNTAMTTVFSGWDTSVWNIPSGVLMAYTTLPTFRAATQDPAPILSPSSFSFTVTLDLNDGEGGMDSVSATFGAAMPSITIPTRDGFAFLGFWTEPNGAGVQFYTASGVSARAWDIADDKTLYAHWRVVLPNNATIHGAPDSHDDVDVQARIVDLTAPVYRIDISWGDMKFEFNTATAVWNSDARKYDGEVAAFWDGMDGTNNQITVSNHSNADVRVSFTVSNIEFAGDVDMEVLQTNAENGDEAVNMELGKVPLPTADARSIEAFLWLSGEPSAAKIEELKNADAWHKVGIITVTITPDGDVLTPLR